MRELEDYEIEVTIITALSKDDILNLEIIFNRQLDTLELLLIAKTASTQRSLSTYLEIIKNMIHEK